MRRLAHHRLSGPARKSTEPREIARFLDFLNGVIGDSGKTLRLAFLLVIAATAIGTMAHLVRIDQQWVWVLLGTLGAGGATRFWHRRESNADRD
jgi:hypothetical protein